MKIKIANYAFDKTAKTVTFSDYVSLNLDQVLLITNTTDNIIIYNFAVPALGGTMAANVLTLDYDTSAMDDTDTLQVFIEDNVGNTLGDKSDSPASTDTGTFSQISLFKRLLQNITNLLQSTGDENDAAASSDTGSFSIIAFIKRSMQNWTTLLAKDFATQTTLSALNSKIPALVTEIPADDTDSNAIAVRALPMHTSRIGYTKVISGGVDPDWGTTVLLGSGMAVNQTGGNLVITSGTTARSETIIRSLASWKGGIRMRNKVILSQRIANQNFFVELVDVLGDGLSYTINSATSITVTYPTNPFTAENIGQSMYIGAFVGTGTFLSGRYPIASISGNDVTYTVSGFAAGTGTCSVFGWNYYQLHYTGTTATSTNFDTQRNGWFSGATIATTTLTSASPGHLMVVTGNDLVATLSDQLVATTTTIAQTVRATRAEGVPDDIELRFQIRVANGSTAPASTTTLTIGLTAVSNYANQDVVLQDVRPMTNAQGLPVEILRSASLTVGGATLSTGNNLAADVGIQYRGTTTGAGTVTNVLSPATPAAQQLKATAGRLFAMYLHNNSASTRWLKVFNLASASITPGTTSATYEIGLSPGQTFEFTMEGGIPFATAISIMITGGQGLNNNTAITANEVTGYTVHV